MGKIYASQVQPISGDELDKKVGSLRLIRNNGTKEDLSGTKLKKEILKVVQGEKTARQVKTYLEKQGVVGSQEKKRKSLLTLIQGGKEKNALSYADKLAIKARQRANIIGGRRTAEGMSGETSMAGRLSAQRGGVGDKEKRVKGRLGNALQHDGVKTNAGDIGAKEREYSVGIFLNRGCSQKKLISQHDNMMHASFSGQNTAGGAATIKNADANPLAGGFGAKKTPSPGLGGTGGNRIIPLSKAA